MPAIEALMQAPGSAAFSSGTEQTTHRDDERCVVIDVELGGPRFARPRSN